MQPQWEWAFFSLLPFLTLVPKPLKLFQVLTLVPNFSKASQKTPIILTNRNEFFKNERFSKIFKINHNSPKLLGIPFFIRKLKPVDQIFSQMFQEIVMSSKLRDLEFHKLSSLNPIANA